MRDTIAKLISTGIIIVDKSASFIKLFSLGILLCELLNGLIPFIDQPATLIMLEKETLTRILRVVQTQAILFLKSMSERGGSDIERL